MCECRFNVVSQLNHDVPYSDLMRKANNWLLANPTIWVKNCESLETRVRGGVTNTDASTSYDMQKRNGFVRCLRFVK